MTSPKKGMHINRATLKRNGKLALCKYDSGFGYGIYLYEHVDWRHKDTPLLWNSRKNEEDARKLFDTVESVLKI